MKAKRKYLLYLILFLFITLPLIIRSSLGKQTAMGGWDAVNSMYPTFLYIKKVSLEFLSNISQGKFSFPMIGYSLGMGEDTFGALNWLGFGDPIYLLFIFFENDSLPYVFTIILYFKIILGGFSFILMSSEIDNSKEDYAYVLGALVYSFTGFTLHCNMFIIFTHAMYCIPLMIYSAERYIKKGKKGTLIFATLLFTLSGFFFLYIGSIALAVYVLYKLITQKASFKRYFNIISNLLIEYILGIGMACIFFMPALYSFFTSNRTSISTLASFFSKELFVNLFKNIFVPQYNSSFQILSLVSVGVIGILVLFTSTFNVKHKRNLIILSLLTTMPIMNCIMSGFGEAYDRWAIVILLYIAFLITQIGDELFQLKNIQKIALTLLLIILVYIGKRGDDEELIDNRRYYITIVSYAIVWFTLMFVIPLIKKWNSTYAKQLCSLILLIVCAYSIHISWEENYLDKPVDCVQQKDVVNELLSNDTDFFRIDNAITYLDPGNYPNMAFLQNYHGIADYYSTQNSYFTNAMQLWNVSPQITGKIIYRGLDNRAVLETLCGVKYMIFPQEESVRIPYGFEFQEMTSDGEWLLYKNSEFLPIIYGYRSVTDNSINSLDGYSIQALISQIACIDSYDGSIELINNDNIINQYISHAISIQNSNTANEIIDVQSDDELHFEMKLLPDCENYILIKHLDVSNVFEIYENGILITKATVSPEYNNGYIGINLGCVNHETPKKYTLKLSNDDQINLQLINYNYSNYHNIISDLRVDIAELNVETNHISAQLNINEPRMLCIAMPYSPGWSAKVDGETIKIHCINNMFMGIDIAEGQHEIELSYCTPGIKLALLITAFSTICAILLIAKGRNSQK